MEEYKNETYPDLEIKPKANIVLIGDGYCAVDMGDYDLYIEAMNNPPKNFLNVVTRLFRNAGYSVSIENKV